MHAVGSSAGLLIAQPGTQPQWLRSGLCEEQAGTSANREHDGARLHGEAKLSYASAAQTPLRWEMEVHTNAHLGAGRTTCGSRCSVGVVHHGVEGTARGRALFGRNGQRQITGGQDRLQVIQKGGL